MKISSFVDAHKCPELAKRYSDKVPKTVDGMMTRLDDFIRLEEAFTCTELPKGEASETPRKSTGPVSRREDWFHRRGYGADRRRNEGRSALNNRDGLVPYRAQTPYQAPRDQGFHHPRGIRGSWSISGGDVRTLLQELEFRYEVAVEKHPDGLGRFRRGHGETIGENQVGSGLRQRRFKNPLSHFLNNTLHGKVSHPKRDRNSGHLDDDHFQVPEVQMAQDDEEKMAFYTDQGTYFYTKMPFGLKNARATYQRLVDAAFQSQIGRNLEAYVDDMVIKSNDEKVLIADIVETFDNLWRINMKLNPKKCSFGVEEGKFLGYVVTSEGIWANPKKTKAIADMQSSRTLKEMQSLSGKLVALKRFLSRSAEKSLPFFKTLKDITKENKDEYRWTESAKKAFQEMKKVIVELPLLTTLVKEETLYVYMAATAEAVSAVLLTERKGKQFQYTTRLRRYFEAQPIKVITDQPLKQILNKAQASRKMAKYSVELGAYNITYELRNAIKGQDLADFFASNSKGSRAGLVLISPSSVEFTYALRLNFTGTNNEVEYEASLTGLRMARKMKVQDIDVKVDSKVMASQINRSTCSGAKAPQNTNDFNHGSVAILPMGNGHPWTPTSSIRKIKVRHYSHRLVHKVNRGEAVGQDYWEGRKEVYVGQHCVSVRAPPEIGMPTHRTMMTREDGNEDELRLNMDILQERREAVAIRKSKYKTKNETKLKEYK
ncbi:reverse transcriptase domain-containing protein [Tanacetum coccineum]